MRKQGKKHSTLTVLPHGMRRNVAWELPIRAALLALDTGKLTEQQCIDLFVLAEMSQRTGAKGHYLEHSKTLHRLICDIGDRVGHPVTKYEALGISASVPVLLEYMQKVKNLDIAKAALREVKK